jgi:ribosome biogenesis GTPase / thiamine phosphate phosphatase
MEKSIIHKGIISGVYGAYYSIYPLDQDVRPDQDSESKEILARLRGRIRIGVGSQKGNSSSNRKSSSEAVSWASQYRMEQMKSRHPVITGDQALFTLERTGDSGKTEALIQEILPREHTIIRSIDFTEHALGTNLSRALLVVSIKDPPPKMNFIDRFLASAHYDNVESHIVFTKTDLLDTLPDDEQEYVQFLINIYKSLGYPVYELGLGTSSANDIFSDIHKENFIKLSEAVRTGITLFTGNSGAGKSTLLNALAGEDLQKTSSISQSSKKGRHTTTNPVLVPREEGLYFFIDTPGVKEWGIQHLDKNDILAAFPEIEPSLGECKFTNCDHSEGVLGCAVRETIEKNMCDDRRSSLESLINSLKYPDKVRTGDYIKPTGRFRNQN